MLTSIPSLPHAAVTHEAAMRTCLAALWTYRRARQYGCPPPYVALCAAEIGHARRVAHATRRTLRIARAMRDAGAFSGTSPILAPAPSHRAIG